MLDNRNFVAKKDLRHRSNVLLLLFHQADDRVAPGMG
jgi:hypothetical protein